MAKDPHAQAEKIFTHMLDLMEELVAFYAENEEMEEEEEKQKVDLDETVTTFTEEAVERGLPEEDAERVLRAAVALAKKASEE